MGIKEEKIKRRIEETMKDKLDLILDNQRIMMKALRGLSINDELRAREFVILTQLNPKEEPTVPEKTKKALSKVAKRGLRK